MSPTNQQGLPFQNDKLSTGVVHIGLGNFARAFIIEYFSELAAKGHKDWGVIAIAPSDRQRHDIQKLTRQDNIYHLIKRNGIETCVPVGSLLSVLIGQYSPQAVIEHIASADTKLVTMTVTQAGYGPLAGDAAKLTSTDIEDIQKEAESIRAGDLKNVRSVPGWIAAGLYKRFKDGCVPCTVVSCDNLPRNGALIEKVIRGYAEKIDPAFLNYIEEKAAFPNSVVDRVTPHQNYAASQKYLAENYHIDNDHCPVICEPYKKWVIEDKFTEAGRPPLDEVGVSFVDDIAAYEDRKLRLLNGSHLSIATISKVLQISNVLEATNDLHVRTFWMNFLFQAAKPLAPLPVKQFVEDTIERIGNPHMTDQIDRLLAATRTKIGARLFNDPALVKGKDHDASAFAIASWIRYLQGRDESGNPFNLHDRDVGAIDSLGLTSSARITENLPAFLEKKDVPADSPIMGTFVNTVVECLANIRNDGMREALESRFGTDPKRAAAANSLTL